jgi:phosphoenolpyruvate-protein kinase (PTS system EI component)
MSERELRGIVVSEGVDVGPAHVVSDGVAAPAGGGAESALEALQRVARELARTEERLVVRGRVTEAEIISSSRLMAADPSLIAEVEALAASRPAAEALRAATDRHAVALEALDDPLLSARAADVRELGRRAVRALSGQSAPEPPLYPSVVVARDLGPAELIDLRLEDGFVLGIALAGGSATSHAAIIARALGVPMVAALGEDVLDARAGDSVVVDGSAGVVVLHPSVETLARVTETAARDAAEEDRLAAGRSLPAVTPGGKTIRLLANASSGAEVDVALRRGAEGVGLVRTELAFLAADDWPTEDEHHAALAPVLGRLEGRIATVRTLDFGADKTPGFLRGRGGRGIALMLEHEEALTAQLAAIVRAGAGTNLRIMLPLVESPVQLARTRSLLRRVVRGGALPELGAMIETPAGVARARELAVAADFFSIGTNDLVATTLGLDRDQPLASPLTARDPAVVELMRRTVGAAHGAGITVEVCGEAAGEPELVPLLVGLGVDELSVSPARLDAIRDAVRGSGQADDEARELGYGLGGVVA